VHLPTTAEISAASELVVAQRQLRTASTAARSLHTAATAASIAAQAATTTATSSVVQRYVAVAGTLLVGHSSLAQAVRDHDRALHDTRKIKSIGTQLSTAKRLAAAAKVTSSAYDVATFTLNAARIAELAAEINELANPLPVTSYAHALSASASRLTKAGATATAPGPGVSIVGPELLNADQIASWYASQHYVNNSGVPIKQLAEMYLEEGSAEGVRGDIAFAQAVHETGGFQIISGKNNYAGIGDCSACGHGYSYSSPRMGVRAQIELLKAYDDPLLTNATTARPVAYTGINTLSVRGAAQTWEQLSTIWAPGSTYGTAVLAIYRSMLLWAVPIPEKPGSSSAAQTATPVETAPVSAKNNGTAIGRPTRDASHTK
jgi:hypothetical protein